MTAQPDNAALPASVRTAAYQLRVIHHDGACAESMENDVFAIAAALAAAEERAQAAERSNAELTALGIDRELALDDDPPAVGWATLPIVSQTDASRP